MGTFLEMRDKLIADASGAKSSSDGLEGRNCIDAFVDIFVGKLVDEKGC